MGMRMVESGRADPMRSKSINGRQKKLWKVLRITLFMLRKGFVFNRSDLHMVMKRGKMVAAKNLKSLVHHSHNHNHTSNAKGSMDLQGYYEFSCSNSPAWALLKKKHNFHLSFNNYFTNCINPSDVTDDPITPYAFSYDFGADYENSASSNQSNDKAMLDTYELADGDDSISTTHSVDMQAEEFISNFYNQMKFQRQVSQIQYEEMLERGAA